MVKGNIDPKECLIYTADLLNAVKLSVLYKHVTNFEIGDQVLMKDERVHRVR